MGKVAVWLLLTILIHQVGCAPGYYGSGASSPEPAPSLSGMTFQNPETPEEQTNRILWEGMSR